MPSWEPEAKWLDQDVFIIGGGRSLKTFDWDLLIPELTIGCNTAYELGEAICKICVFGDIKWWHKHKSHLAEYKGVVFTNASQLINKNTTPWLWTMRREAHGLHHNALGWNSNTGSIAINLALILGAKRIYLLGYDMQLSEGKPNWHDNLIDKPNAAIYNKSQEGFKKVHIDWQKKFSDREIINVTDNSNLDTFPKIGTQEFWNDRNKQRMIA